MMALRNRVPLGTAERVKMCAPMSHTCTSLLVHCVFSTKNRVGSIHANVQPRLWSYIGGIARTNHMKAIAVGGMRDHVHVLLLLPATMPVAKAVQLIKAGSSKWMHEEMGEKLFAWQEAYGAFTVGISQLLTTVNYIQNQAKHHTKAAFHEEWKAILTKHGLDSKDE